MKNHLKNKEYRMGLEKKLFSSWKNWEIDNFDYYYRQKMKLSQYPNFISKQWKPKISFYIFSGLVNFFYFHRRYTHMHIWQCGYHSNTSRSKTLLSVDLNYLYNFPYTELHHWQLSVSVDESHKWQF